MVDAPTFDPPSPDREKSESVTNELTVLAEFISDHADNPFDRHLSVLLDETGQMHDLWAANCKVAHFHDDIPCDEYERGVSLAIAWLKARIEGGVSDAS